MNTDKEEDLCVHQLPVGNEKQSTARVMAWAVDTVLRAAEAKGWLNPAAEGNPEQHNRTSKTKQQQKSSKISTLFAKK